MAGARKRGEEIRQFILDQVEKHPADIAKVAGETFGISRQAVNRHIQQLIAENLLTIEGATRNRRYSLKPLMQWEQRYPLDGSLEEDRVWRNDIAPRLGELPKNVLDIWHYGFTEMLNNAIDHSSGTFVEVSLIKTCANTNIILRDDGEGIFKKIQREMKLDDERHALLELSKGKLTTDPSRHSGEGIFFSSRAFDLFEILSGDIHFSHQIDQAEDWIDDGAAGPTKGTWIIMTLSNHASQILKDIFDRFTSGEDFGFTKTIVPVHLAQYGDEMLVSRSQAKRLLARIEKFKTVLLDFAGVSAIGQAFADEIFRVFAKIHPNIELIPINTNPDVQKMISRALHHED
jgi:biotin operon repressor